MKIVKCNKLLKDMINIINESNEIVVSIGPADSNKKIAEKWISLAKKNKNKKVYLAPKGSGHGHDDYWAAYTDEDGLIFYSNGITMGGDIKSATSIVKRWARDLGVRDKIFDANPKDSIKKTASKLKKMADENSPGGIELRPTIISAVFGLYALPHGYEGYIGKRKALVDKDGEKVAKKVVKAWKEQFKTKNG